MADTKRPSKRPSSATAPAGSGERPAATVPLAPKGKKIGEGPGNLRARAAAFNRRRQSS